MVNEQSFTSNSRNSPKPNHRRLRDTEVNPDPDTIYCASPPDATTSRPSANKTKTRSSGKINNQLNEMAMPNTPLTMENINSILIDRLDKNVTVQTEILSRLEKMIVVQEEKIDQQEKLGASIVKMVEDRRRETDQKFDDHSRKLVEVEKTLGNTLITHLSDLRNDQNNRHKEFSDQQKDQLDKFTESLSKINEKTDSRITKIERVIYAIIGISGAVTLFIEYIVPIIHK